MKTLKTLFSLLLITVMMSSCCQQANKTSKIEKKDIGIQLYSVRDDIAKNFTETVKAVGETGFTFVEAAGYNDGKFYSLSPEEFTKAIEAAGMKALSSHTNRPLASANPDSIKWDDVWKWWDQCITAHKAAGMKYLVNSWMPVPKTLAELKTYCDYYNKIGEKCKVQGLKFGYHNHSFEFEKIEDETMYDYMLKNTNPDYVFFEMDVYCLIRGGCSPVDYFNNYPGRFKLLHIKDNKELGQSGMVGFDAIFKNIEKAGTKHIIVEVESYSSNLTPVESIKQSLDYLSACPLVKKSYDTKTE